MTHGCRPRLTIVAMFKLANGWLGTSFLPEHAAVFLDHLQTGLARSQRSMADLDVQAGGYFEVGEDVENLIAARKPAMAFTLGGMGSAKTNFYNLSLIHI